MILTRVPLLSLLVFVIGGVVLLIVFLVPRGHSVDDKPTVDSPVGKIQGLKASGGEYYMFLGIPYGQVDASNHFGASTPYPKFEEMFVADSDLVRCPQLHNNNTVGVIDCLQLNVFVPRSASSSNPLPVMVWIEGEDFETAGNTKSHYGPKYLLQHDVIYVAINYRVGPYGFMCLDIAEAPGNQGLKDQVLALRWVRDNIEAFGGDAKRITVAGMSAGAQSVDFHIHSNNEQLFKNAIMQSGSSLVSDVYAEPATTAPIIIAQSLGYNPSSLKDALSFLSTKEPNLVLQASNVLGLTFKPCVEKVYANVEPFMTRPWVNANIPKAKRMAILIGYNEQEQLLQYVTPDAFENYDVINKRLRELFDFDQERLAIAERVLRLFYFGDRRINSDVMWEAVNVDTDFKYAHPIHRSIHKYLESEPENVFFYVLSYNGGRNAAKFAANVNMGSAAHGDEAGYLFDMDIFSEDPTAADQLIIDRMTTMWTNFAKYSDPTPQTTNQLPVKWSAVSQSSFDYLSINTEMVVSRTPENRRIAFLDLLFKYNFDHQRGI